MHTSVIKNIYVYINKANLESEYTNVTMFLSVKKTYDIVTFAK